MSLRDQRRRRSIFASICLFAVGLLYTPLAAAAWSSHQMACCTSGQCPIAAHHHHKAPAAPADHMDCGHEMPGMMACAMSCCHDSERSLVISIAFVLPPPAASATVAVIESPIEFPKLMDFPRSSEPLFSASSLRLSGRLKRRRSHPRSLINPTGGIDCRAINPF